MLITALNKVTASKKTSCRTLHPNKNIHIPPQYELIGILFLFRPYYSLQGLKSHFASETQKFTVAKKTQNS